MARKKDLQALASKHDLQMISIDEISHYRKAREVSIESTGQAQLPTKKWGDLMIEGFFNPIDKSECVTVYPRDFVAQDNVLVRVHSSCFTGDLLESLRCDCGPQLSLSLEKIRKEKGILIYLNQEGRGIGLLQKIKAYALQEQGLDTVEANLKLGFKADERDFCMAAQVLKTKAISTVRLLTNNNDKVEQLVSYGIKVSCPSGKAV